MKVRSGFVSNSSSSSFIVLKDSITAEQRDQILNFQEWVKVFIAIDEEKWKDEPDIDDEDSDMEKYKDGSPYWDQQYNRLKYKFEYYTDGYWRMNETDDYIFGATTMDNFGMDEYFKFIKVNDDFVRWDDGWVDEPSSRDLGFIHDAKQKYRKRKLDKVNKINENNSD